MAKSECISPKYVPSISSVLKSVDIWKNKPITLLIISFVPILLASWPTGGGNWCHLFHSQQAWFQTVAVVHLFGSNLDWSGLAKLEWCHYCCHQSIDDDTADKFHVAFPFCGTIWNSQHVACFFQQRVYLITIFLDFGEIWSLHGLKCPFEFYLFHRFCFSPNHRPVPLVGNILHGAQIVFHYIQNAMHYFHLFHRISNELGDPVRQELANAANIGKMSDPSLGLQMPEKLGPSFNTAKLRAQYSQYPF